MEIKGEYRDILRRNNAAIIDTGWRSNTIADDFGRFLAALMKKPGGENRWQGPYLKKDVPSDPWGTPYQYRQPGEHGEFDLFSFGKDGKPGGEDEAADITNW